MESAIDIEMLKTVWGIIIFLCLYIILLFVLMEISLGKTKEKNGKLQVNKNGFILRSIYNLNCESEHEHKTYPKNLCEFFWGLFFSLLFWGILKILMLIYFITIKPIEKLVFYLGCILLGRIPFGKDEKGLRFKPYQRYGKNNEKKFIAGWKFCAPMLALYVYYYHASSVINCASSPLVTTIACVIGMLVALVAIVVTFVMFMNWLTNKTSFPLKMTALKTFLKSKKEKVCPLIDIVEE